MGSFLESTLAVGPAKELSSLATPQLPAFGLFRRVPEK